MQKTYSQKTKTKKKVIYPWMDKQEWIDLHQNIEVISTLQKPYKYDKSKNITIVFYKEIQ